MHRHRHSYFFDNMSTERVTKEDHRSLNSIFLPVDDILQKPFRKDREREPIVIL